MSLVEGCKHALEITIPVEVIGEETKNIVVSFQKRARIPGFRPGKAPASLVQKSFERDIRQQVLESLIPKYFDQEVEREKLKLAGQPNIVDVHFHPGEPLRFKAEFEVFPEVELRQYRGLSVPYKDPEVSEEDVTERVEQIRNDKATFVNEDPRPLADGDFAVISLHSLEGTEEPVHTDEISLEIGGKDTLEAFSTNLRGMSPGEEKDFDVTYPEEYGQSKLAGKTVRFHAVVIGVRRKELPGLTDEFAQDLGDYRTVDELRAAVQKGIFAQRQMEAQREAKDKLVDVLVDQHDFPVPELFVDRQIRNRVEQSLRSLAAEGVDPKSLQLDWEKMKSSQRDRALREVKASLLLGRVAEQENIQFTPEDCLLYTSPSPRD